MKLAFVSALPRIHASEQIAELHKDGFTDKQIYINGRGAESLGAVAAAFRGRPGELVIAADLRVFGESRKAILEQLAMLERLQISVRDVAHPGDNQPLMINRAQDALAAYSRWRGSKKTAAKSGRLGGKTKAVIAALKRATIAEEWVVRNVVNCEALDWDQKVAMFNGKISKATLRRHYWDKPTRKGRKWRTRSLERARNSARALLPPPSRHVG